MALSTLEQFIRSTGGGGGGGGGVGNARLYASADPTTDPAVPALTGDALAFARDDDGRLTFAVADTDVTVRETWDDRPVGSVPTTSPMGTPYTQDGSWQVKAGGVVGPTVSKYGSYLAFDVGATDYELSAKLVHNSDANGTGLAVRFRQLDDALHIIMRSGRVELNGPGASASNTIARWDGAYSGSTAGFTLGVKLVGDTVHVILNGVDLGEPTTGSRTTTIGAGRTKAALFPSTNNVAAAYDDLTIKVAGDTAVWAPAITPSVASAVSVAPTGGIGATDVQAALGELDAEKAPKDSPVFTGTVGVNGSAIGGHGINAIGTVDRAGETVGAYLGFSAGPQSTHFYGIRTQLRLGDATLNYQSAAYNAAAPRFDGEGGSVKMTAGLRVMNQGATRVQSADGILVEPQQGASVASHGIRIGASDTATLQLAYNTNPTTPNAGIAFGSSRDTNLYRSAAATLRTNGAFEAGGSSISVGTNPAQIGAVRLPNSEWVMARNAANTGNLNLIAADGSNVVKVAPTAALMLGAPDRAIGFYGATPVARPSGTPADATDATTAIALVNDLKAKLIALGLIA